MDSGNHGRDDENILPSSSQPSWAQHYQPIQPAPLLPSSNGSHQQQQQYQQQSQQHLLQHYEPHITHTSPYTAPSASGLAHFNPHHPVYTTTFVPQNHGYQLSSDRMLMGYQSLPPMSSNPYTNGMLDYSTNTPPEFLPTVYNANHHFGDFTAHSPNFTNGHNNMLGTVQPPSSKRRKLDNIFQDVNHPRSFVGDPLLHNFDIRSEPAVFQTYDDHLQNFAGHPVKFEDHQENSQANDEMLKAMSSQKWSEGQTLDKVREYLKRWKQSDPEICSICLDGAVAPDNVIVYCDGPMCDVLVHQQCYGIPVAPGEKESWFCERCQAHPDEVVSCALCPSTSGAFRRLTTVWTDEEGSQSYALEFDAWVHLVCASWMPDMTLDDPTIMSNLSVENMDARRWEWVCSICGISGEDGSAGACVRCDAGGCRNAMHVTCAQDWQLMEMDESDLESGMSNPFFIFCKQHCKAPDRLRLNAWARWVAERDHFLHELTVSSHPELTARHSRQTFQTLALFSRSLFSKQQAQKSAIAQNLRKAVFAAVTDYADIKAEARSGKTAANVYSRLAKLGNSIRAVEPALQRVILSLQSLQGSSRDALAAFRTREVDGQQLRILEFADGGKDDPHLVKYLQGSDDALSEKVPKSRRMQTLRRARPPSQMREHHITGDVHHGKHVVFNGDM